MYEGYDVLGGQPRHCICTTASRGLSTTAEFLIGKLLVVFTLTYAMRSPLDC